jgi:hypothetical protein
VDACAGKVGVDPLRPAIPKRRPPCADRLRPRTPAAPADSASLAPLRPTLPCSNVEVARRNRDAVGGIGEPKRIS